jgi:hypothetical protein
MKRGEDAVAHTLSSRTCLLPSSKMAVGPERNRISGRVSMGHNTA